MFKQTVKSAPSFVKHNATRVAAAASATFNTVTDVVVAIEEDKRQAKFEADFPVAAAFLNVLEAKI